MNGINKVTLMGAIGPMTHTVRDGQAEASFHITVSRCRPAKDGEQHEEQDRIPCVVSGRIAEILASYVQQGRRVYCEGHIRISQRSDLYEAKYVQLAVVIDTMQLLSAAGGSVEIG